MGISRDSCSCFVTRLSPLSYEIGEIRRSYSILVSSESANFLQADFHLRLLARNNLRIAPAILNPRTRCGADPELSATTFIPALWREVKIVVDRVHKVDAGAHELYTCERRYSRVPCKTR